MNLLKQLITDAKKQRAMVAGQTNNKNTHHKGDLVNIPTIEVDEVQTMYIDEKLFEYDMIQRAREAELILSEILANCKFVFSLVFYLWIVDNSYYGSKCKSFVVLVFISSTHTTLF